MSEVVLIAPDANVEIRSYLRDKTSIDNSFRVDPRVLSNRQLAWAETVRTLVWRRERASVVIIHPSELNKIDLRLN